VPVPIRDAPFRIKIHGTPDAAVHAQALDVETDTVSAPPAGGAASDEGEMLNVQEGAVVDPQRAAAASARTPAIRRSRGIGATSVILRPAGPARKIDVGMKIGF
jgi:hypothetical protein